MIDSLFHITHLDNVPGILSEGLLCRNRIEEINLPYLDLSDAACQARRSCRYFDGHSIDLHDYVPLFIEPRNAMLYRLQKTLTEAGTADQLAILEVSPDPIRWRASLLADGIASSPSTSLFHARDPEAWDALDWDAIDCRSWMDQPDPQAAKRHKMAEVMVDDLLARHHIRKVWLRTPSAATSLRAKLGEDKLPEMVVDQDRSLFFS
ncbi:DUF4433 domain-containing protein [Cyanobium sp. CH-040]|uniref:DUF4433 domain-containing protein n=1 Tax=Cyanobium sp. CH-040 TaxID=2823708 RepID=UPI0020CC239D|nr:DUF4433 domain-containing protein [Cyanobium sp. CH-040]MCP9928836.1 DUF4433 domain-containing protein [Cyanobium sp. CH-040]